MIPSKKSITVIMVISLLFFPYASTVNAISYDQPIEGLKESIVDQIMEMDHQAIQVIALYPLLDINLQKNYTLATFSPQGYAIIANRSLEISEYALDNETPLPYKNILGSDDLLVYGGPNNYAYTQDRKTFYDAMTKDILVFQPSKEQQIINATLLSVDPKNPTVNELEIRAEVLKWKGIHETLLIRYNGGMWINNEENYPIGNGICGPIAAATILSYYQDYVDHDILPTNLRELGSSDPGNLIYLLEKHIGGSYTGTIAVMIYFGLKQFLDSYKITDYQPHMTMLGTWDVVKKSVDDMRPIAVGLTNWAGSPEIYGNHWVTVYAYAVNSKNKGFYKAIDNQGNFKARINASWTIGAVWLSK
jgi:hypothetical protein